MRLSMWSVAVTLGFAWTSVASGQNIVGRSTGLGQPTSTIDFSEVALVDNTPVFDQFASLGAIVSGSLFYGNPPAFGGSPFTTPAVYNYSLNPPLCCTGMFAIFYTSVLQATAFHFVTLSATSTLFEAVLNGQVVSSFTATTGTDPSLWYGFENLAFDAIQITPGSPIPVAAGLDNLQMSTGAISAIPEPATMVLVATGLLGLGLAGFRRRRQARSIRAAESAEPATGG